MDLKEFDHPWAVFFTVHCVVWVVGMGIWERVTDGTISPSLIPFAFVYAALVTVFTYYFEEGFRE